MSVLSLDSEIIRMTNSPKSPSCVCDSGCVTCVRLRVVVETVAVVMSGDNFSLLEAVIVNSQHQVSTNQSMKVFSYP